MKSGSLKTPGYGDKYPTGVTCLWRINPEVEQSSYIEIIFKRNDIGNCRNKGFDMRENLPRNGLKLDFLRNISKF